MWCLREVVITVLGFVISNANGDSWSGPGWAGWWTYDIIAGPSDWGRVNPDWELCAIGKQQSPIDFNPKLLLFDPNLKFFQAGTNTVSGTLVNRANYVTFIVDGNKPVHLRGGPLSYSYTVTNVTFHFGSKDGNGSEHTIAGKHMDAEIQVLGYNSDLYMNLTSALSSPNGLAMLSILAKVGSSNNTEIEKFASMMRRVKFKGQTTRIRDVSIKNLLPATTNYMTYEGSLTKPGCEEGVTWVVMNKPIYITKNQMAVFRQLRRDDESRSKLMADNTRPTQPLFHRVVRTNINFSDANKKCTMKRAIGYAAKLLKQ